MTSRGTACRIVIRLLWVICALCLSFSFSALRSRSQQISAANPALARGTVRTIARDIATKTEAAFSLAVGGDRNVYVAVSGLPETTSARATPNIDAMTNRVFVVEPDGALKIFAGSGAKGFAGDGGLASEAELDLGVEGAGTTCCAATSATLAASRSGIAVDAEGNVFIADTRNATVRRIAGPASSEPMIIRSIAGRWAGASRLELMAPAGLAIDASGDLYIADVAANRIAALRGNELETLAHVKAPSAIAVNAAGTKVYVASLDAGRVFEIDRRSDATRGVVGTLGDASAAPAGDVIREVAHGLSPSGLAMDAAENLFIADSKANVIKRLDARSGAIAAVAGTGTAWFAGDGGPAMRAEFKAPGDLAFDGDGNLFVADEGNRAIREIAQIGVAQGMSSVTLTPAGGINFGNQATGGTAPAQAFTLTNGSNAPLTNLSFNFTGADSGDFSQTNSCGSSVAANSSCAINVTFAPQATGARSATLQAADSDPSSPQSAPVSGFGDDFEITAQANKSTTINIAAGSTATFDLQVAPDSVFSGTVALQCPINLPAETTCTFSPTSVKVAPGKAQPFTAAFATTVHQMVPLAPEGPQFPALRRFAVRMLGILFFLFAARRFGSVMTQRYRRVRPTIVNPSKVRLRQEMALACALGAVAAFAGGCHHGSKATVGTQAGTYTMTVTGSAQNAGRGFTVTLIVQ